MQQGRHNSFRERQRCTVPWRHVERPPGAAAGSERIACRLAVDSHERGLALRRGQGIGHSVQQALGHANRGEIGHHTQMRCNARRARMQAPCAVDEQYVARRNVRDLPGVISSLKERLSQLTADEATVTAQAEAPIIIGDRRCLRDDAPGLIAGQLDSLPRQGGVTRRIPLGVYRGLRFGLILHPQFPADVYLEGAATRQSGLSREHQGPRAILNALERLTSGYRTECARIQQDLAIAESQVRDYQTRLGQPFLHDAVLSELAAVRERLKACLSGAKPEPGAETQPSISELVERVKSLRAANAAVPTGERIGKRRSSAEEPVTARIRRRMEGLFSVPPTESAS